MPTELLSDLDFQPNIREIRNQIQVAYYNHDDTQLANYVNQLGKALEQFGYFEEAQKCHMLDARISQCQHNNSGFLVAVGNLALSLAMSYSDDEHPKEEFDFGFFTLFSIDLGTSADIVELVTRKFIFAAHYSCRSLPFPDPDAMHFLATNGYLGLLETFMHERNYWESLAVAAQTLQQFGFLQTAKTYIDALTENVGKYKRNDLTLMSLYELRITCSLLEEAKIADSDEQGLIQTIARIGKNDLPEAADTACRIADSILGYGAFRHSGFGKTLLVYTNQDARQFILKCERIKNDLAAANQDDLIIACINLNQTQRQFAPESVKCIANYHVYFFLQNQYCQKYKINTFSAAFCAVVDSFPAIDSRVMFGVIDILYIAARQVLLYYDFNVPNSLNALVKIVFHITQRIVEESETVDDFIELLLNCCHRNRISTYSGFDESILRAMQVNTDFDLQYCMQKLTELIGFQYSEEQLMSRLMAKQSIDSLMLASGLVKQVRQSQKQIFYSSGVAKSIPEYKKKRSIKRIASGNGKNEKIKPLSSYQATLDLSRLQAPKKSVDDFVIDNSSTYSISDYQIVVKTNSSGRPKILTKSITSSSLLSPSYPREHPQSTELEDALAIPQIMLLSRPSSNTQLASKLSLVDVQQPSYPSPQGDYYEFQRFVASNGYENLSSEEKIMKYREFLMLRDLLSNRAQSAEQPSRQNSIEQNLTGTSDSHASRPVQPIADAFCNDETSTALRYSEKYIADYLLARQFKRVVLHRVMVDRNVCAALEQQKHLENLEISASHAQAGTLCHAIIKMPSLRRLSLHVHELSATQALNIVVSSSCVQMEFSHVLGLELSDYEVINAVNQRCVDRIRFSWSNFIRVRPVDVIAGLLDLRTIEFQQCLNAGVFVSALKGVCEASIAQILEHE